MHFPCVGELISGPCSSHYDANDNALGQEGLRCCRILQWGTSVADSVCEAPHPASMANEQTQGFSFRFIIVTMTEFLLLSFVILSVLSSNQPVNHPQLTNKPSQPAISRDAHCRSRSLSLCHTHARAHTHTHTRARRKSHHLIKMWWLSGTWTQTGPDRCLTPVTSKGK